MNSIPLANATRRLGAPRNWNHEHDGLCHTLEICDQDGWMISAWLPTKEELRRLNEGAPLLLHIQGVSHPVVGMSIADPKEIQIGTCPHV